MDRELKITKFVRDGELIADDGTVPLTVGELLDRAGRLLDNACSHDICGEVLFVGDDGNMYVATTEVVVAKAAPAYVADSLVEQVCECNECSHFGDACTFVKRDATGKWISACPICGKNNFAFTGE